MTKNVKLTENVPQSTPSRRCGRPQKIVEGSESAPSRERGRSQNIVDGSESAPSKAHGQLRKIVDVRKEETSDDEDWFPPVEKSDRPLKKIKIISDAFCNKNREFR